MKTSPVQQPSQTIPNKPIPRHSKKWWVVFGVVAIAVVWLGTDLYGSHSTDIRKFDPNEVARLETAMWKSYYDKERLKLFEQLAELLRKEYHFPLAKSHTVAFQASKAAFVFKDGHGRADYEKTLPNLVNYYSAIQQASTTKFDVNQAAKLELEWWIIHRERESHQPGDLVQALADLGGEVYQIPSERLMEHARLRAEAMTIRDSKARAGGVTPEDWRQIEQLLQSSWQSLYQAVNAHKQ